MSDRISDDDALGYEDMEWTVFDGMARDEYGVPASPEQCCSAVNNQAKQIKALQARLDRVTELVEKWERERGPYHALSDSRALTYREAIQQLEQALKGEEAQHDALKKEQGL